MIFLAIFIANFSRIFLNSFQPPSFSIYFKFIFLEHPKPIIKFDLFTSSKGRAMQAWKTLPLCNLLGSLFNLTTWTSLADLLRAILTLLEEFFIICFFFFDSINCTCTNESFQLSQVVNNTKVRVRTSHGRINLSIKQIRKDLPQKLILFFVLLHNSRRYRVNNFSE